MDPETTSVLLTSTIKYDSASTTKSADTLKSDIVTTITNYNTNTLQKFDAIYRHSKLTGLIDSTDSSILSNITTIKLENRLHLLYYHLTNTIYILETHYLIHIQVTIQALGGILSSTGFKIDGNDNEMFLDDDGAGNVRFTILLQVLEHILITHKAQLIIQQDKLH